MSDAAPDEGGSVARCIERAVVFVAPEPQIDELEVICKVLPLTPPLTRSRVFMLSRNWGYSIERARRELDYRPRVDHEEGIKRTAAWYREQGHL